MADLVRHVGVVMELMSNWKAIATKAWSMRLILLAGLLSGLEYAMPAIVGFFEPLNIIPSGVLSLAAALVSAAALVARVVAQPKAGL